MLLSYINQCVSTLTVELGWPKGATWYEYDKTTPVRPFVGAVTGKWHNNGGHQVFIINGQTLPLQHAIQRIRGNGKRKVAIIADPNCPRARELGNL